MTLVPGSLAGHAESRYSGPSPVKDEPTWVLVGAGDIADCRGLGGAEATAKLLDQIPGTVMAVGDLAYPDGSKENFVCYDKTWGRAKSRTRPSPGNHEFHASGPRLTLIILAFLPASTRPAITATISALGTSLF